MTLLNVNPFVQVEKMLNDVLNTSVEEVINNKPMASRPAVNISEQDDRFILDLAIPGLSKEDITINVEDDLMKISADKKVETSAGLKMKKREFNYNKFSRTFRLNEQVDQNAISATSVNGVLTISLMKKEEAKKQGPKTISVQ